MIDLHCHIDLYKNPQQVAQECSLRKMHVLSVTTTPSAWKITSQLVEDIKNIKTALGLHPQLARERKSELALFDALLNQTQYVGEVGLDGSPDFSSSWEDQITVFEHILDSCSRAGGKILSIHSRRAGNEVVDLLGDHKGCGKAILHWFSGTKKELYKATDLGCWFSVGPAMLNSNKGRELTKLIPQDRVLTETDGPFAAVDGKTLMPWDVDQAIIDLGHLWDIPFDHAEEVIRQNFIGLLNK